MNCPPSDSMFFTEREGFKNLFASDVDLYFVILWSPLAASSNFLSKYKVSRLYDLKL